MLRVAGLLLLALALCQGGCIQPAPRVTLSSPDPAIKVRAIVRVTREHRDDPATLRALVAELSNEDGAVRMYAIRALRTLTGQSFDYHFYETEHQRQGSVDRWQKWLSERQPQPTTQVSAGRTGGSP